MTPTARERVLEILGLIEAELAEMRKELDELAEAERQATIVAARRIARGEA